MKKKKINISFNFKKDLINGENPFQVPCEIIYNSKNSLTIFNAKRHNNNKLCYTNCVDIDHLLNLILDLQKSFKNVLKKIPFIAIVAKHGNPCGISFNWSSKVTAIKQAFNANKKAVLGAEFICNFKINEELSKSIYFQNNKKKRKIDIIFAHSYTKRALKILKERKFTKLLSDNKLLLENLKLKNIKVYKQINGGFICQP